MKKILIIAAVILLLGLIVFHIVRTSKKENAPFKRIEMSGTNHVFNQTNKTYMDTIVWAGLKSLNIDSTVVVIRPLFKDKTTDSLGEVSIIAYIVGDDKQYIMYIDGFDRTRAIEVISHELIHLEQYKTDKLVIKLGKAYWMGKEVNVKSIVYDMRPWEMDAEVRKLALASKMRAILVR